MRPKGPTKPGWNSGAVNPLHQLVVWGALLAPQRSPGQSSDRPTFSQYVFYVFKIASPATFYSFYGGNYLGVTAGQKVCFSPSKEGVIACTLIRHWRKLHLAK